MKRLKQQTFGLALIVLAFVCAMTVSAAAQDVTHPSTTETVGTPTHEVQSTHVQNAEVIHVSGHEIVVELENGKFELLNLGEDATFQVDGKDLTVHELTPATKLSQEIHTVTTPEQVTTLRTLNGKVWRVSPPHYLIVTLPGGRNTEFRVPDDTVFRVNGTDKTIFDLREGMKISATVLTVEPVHRVTTHTVVTGQAPPRPNVAFEGPMLIEGNLEMNRETPAITAAVEERPIQELPKTAGVVPLIGFLGMCSLGLYAGMRLLRSRTS